MKKQYSLLLCMLLFLGIIGLLLFQRGSYRASSLDDVPHWIKGKLVIGTIGSEMEIKSGEYPLLQSICFFDFDNSQISSIFAGLDNELLQGCNNGSLYITGRAHDGYSDGGELNYHSGMKNRDYDLREIVYDEKKLSFYCKNDYGDIHHFINHDTSIAIVGIAEKNNRVFYLRYAISEEDEIVVEIVSRKRLWTRDDKPIVYASLPMNAVNSQIAISENGVVAFTGDAGEVYYSDGCSIKKVVDDQCCSNSICWLDHDTLLYTACIKQSRLMGLPSSYMLRLWHLSTNSYEDLVLRENGEDATIPDIPRAMCFDTNNQQLAFLLSGESSYKGTSVYAEKGRIMIFDLITGQHFTFIPWNTSLEKDKEYLYNNYGKDNAGLFFYDPGFFYDAKMFWYP